jgi:hypothetical protein
MPLNGPQLWFRVSAVKNIYVFKTHTSFLLWWPPYRQNCNVFPAMPAGRRLESYRTGPDIVKPDVIKKSDVIK